MKSKSSNRLTMNSLIKVLIITIVLTSIEARTARNEQISQTNVSVPKATPETTAKPSTVTRPTSTAAVVSSTPSTTQSTTTTKVTSSPSPQPEQNKLASSNNSTITNRIQNWSNSGSNLAGNLFTSLSKNLSQLINQITKRFNLPIKAVNTGTVNSLWSSIRRSDLAQSPLTLSVASVTFAGALSLVALYLFPSLREASIPLFKDRNQIKRIGELGRSIDQIAETVDAAIDSYSRSEPDTCIKIALCTLGKAKEVSRKSRAIDAVNTVLTFPGLDQYLISNKEWLESHAYGREGNDCDTINYKQQCPFNYATWKVLLSSLSKVI